MRLLHIQKLLSDELQEFCVAIRTADYELTSDLQATCYKL